MSAQLTLHAPVESDAPELPPNLWADGALTVKDAMAFSALSRDDLFDLMRDRVLPFAKKDSKGTRIIPRRSLVAYLEALHETGEVRPTRDRYRNAKAKKRKPRDSG